MNSLPVLVVGGGIGGLVAARALGRLGIPVELVERSPALRPLGAGITLGANAMRVLGTLGLADAITERARAIRLGSVTDERGRLLASADLDGIEARHGKAYAIHRARLHEVLSDGIESSLVRLRLGAELRELSETEDGVVVTLASGVSFPVRAVVGADGLHSRVRELAFGSHAPEYAGYTCFRWTGSVPGGLEGAVEMWGRGSRAGLVPLPGEEVYTFFVTNAEAGTPRAQELGTAGRVRALFAHYRGDVPRVLDALGPDSTRLLHHDVEEIRLKRWTNGRVALLGDAAHAMTPNLGQGAAMAIEDALVLARELAAHDREELGLRAYETRRRARVEEIQNGSRRLGVIAQWRAPWAVWARNRALALAPEKSTERSIERIVAYVP